MVCRESGIIKTDELDGIPLRIKPHGRASRHNILFCNKMGTIKAELLNTAGLLNAAERYGLVKEG